MDVRLLWIGSYGTTHAEVSMVEEISHKTTTGKIFEHYILHAIIYNQSTVGKKPNIILQLPNKFCCRSPRAYLEVSHKGYTRVPFCTNCYFMGNIFCIFEVAIQSPLDFDLILERNSSCFRHI